MSLAPNPSVHETTLTIRSNEKGTAMLKIMNALGKLVLKSHISIQSGVDQLLIPTDNLEEGVYFVSLEMKTSAINKKLFIK